MSYIKLVTGGTKSGKSEFAEYLASSHKNITYIALSEARPDDNNWQKKISYHKKRRPNHWRIVETLDLISILRKETQVLLIDSIGGFVAGTILLQDDEWERLLNELIFYLKKYDREIIIVAEQVGWGLVSEYEIGNKFAERIGNVNKVISAIATENWLAINGRIIKLDDIFYKFES